MNFRITCQFLKKDTWNFDRVCTEVVDEFGKYCYLNNIVFRSISVCSGEEPAQLDGASQRRKGSRQDPGGLLESPESLPSTVLLQQLGPALPAGQRVPRVLGPARLVHQHICRARVRAWHTVGTQQVCWINARLSIRNYCFLTSLQNGPVSFWVPTATRKEKERWQIGSLLLQVTRCLCVFEWVCAVVHVIVHGHSSPVPCLHVLSFLEINTYVFFFPSLARWIHSPCPLAKEVRSPSGEPPCHVQPAWQGAQQAADPTWAECASSTVELCPHRSPWGIAWPRNQSWLELSAAPGPPGWPTHLNIGIQRG